MDRPREPAWPMLWRLLFMFMDRWAALYLLDQYKRILDAIYFNGVEPIWYDKGRMDAYVIIAKLASSLRKEMEAQ